MKKEWRKKTKGSFKKGHIAWNKGIHHSEKTKDKMRKKAHKLWQNPDYRRRVISNHSGEKAWNWKGGLEKRKHRTLKLRFQIFQRDNFTCRYCGRKPPECILEIDHKYPKSKGGLDKIENYITSCRECNRGKGDYILKEFE